MFHSCDFVNLIVFHFDFVISRWLRCDVSDIEDKKWESSSKEASNVFDLEDDET